MRIGTESFLPDRSHILNVYIHACTHMQKCITHVYMWSVCARMYTQANMYAICARAMMIIAHACIHGRQGSYPLLEP